MGILWLWFGFGSTNEWKMNRSEWKVLVKMAFIQPVGGTGGAITLFNLDSVYIPSRLFS